MHRFSLPSTNLKNSSSALKTTLILGMPLISVIAGVARRNEIDCRILFSLREDYFTKLDEFRQKLPIIFDHSYRVGPLSAFGARQAFTRPLRRSDISFDSRLTSDLLDDLAKVNFDPALLQIVC